MTDREHIPLVVIAGATGTGKSAAALHLANALDGVIVNADSRQVYRDFPIITAQPSAEETARAPHMLYGFLRTEEKLNAGMYADLAAKTIREIHTAGRLPILVGGTGLYLRTLLQGIAPIPPVPESIANGWQIRCQAEGPQALHALLQERDPETAARLHPNDSQRITRALEVQESTGKPLSYWHALPVPEPPYRACAIHVDMPIADLEPRLAARVDAMLDTGAVEEARAALMQCDNPHAPGWSGIGCMELYRHLREDLSLDQCRTEWIANTRAYAKRQRTWFKRERDMQPFDPRDTESMLVFCRQQLATPENP